MKYFIDPLANQPFAFEASNKMGKEIISLKGKLKAEYFQCTTLTTVFLAKKDAMELDINMRGTSMDHQTQDGYRGAKEHSGHIYASPANAIH